MTLIDERAVERVEADDEVKGAERELIERAEIRDAMAKHTKRIAAAMKEAAAAAKANAIAAVEERTTEAKAAGASVFVAQLGDFTDPAALKDAAAVAFKQGVACALFSKDPIKGKACLLYTSPSPRDISGSRMPSSA